MAHPDPADDSTELLNIRASVNEIFKSASQLNQTSVDFLKIDLDTALSFAGIALETSDNPEKKTRNQQNARHGYDTIVRLLPRVSPSVDDGKVLARKLEQLKSELVKLGERF